MNKQRKIINVHCHFMTFDHLPDAYTKKLPKLTLGLPIAIPEFFIKIFLAARPFGWIFTLFRAMKDKNTWEDDKPKENGAIDTYMKTGEYKIKKIFKETNPPYDLVTPLMMDMITASNIYILTDVEGVIDFPTQIKRYSNCVIKYPYRVFPFVMFNPMREESYNLVVNAIENQGFIGIKMYPAMGFYAEPERNTYNTCRWKDTCVHRYKCSRQKKSLCCESLEKVYIFANENSLPITVHTAYTSMQNIELKSEEAALYTDVSDFNGILERYPNIRINFAHFGGTEFISCAGERDKNNEKANHFKKSCQLRNDIAYLMRKFNKKTHQRVFADTAANLLLLPCRRKKYFKVLYNLLKCIPYKNAILFGTDTPAICFLTGDKKYRKKFTNGLKNAHKDYLKKQYKRKWKTEKKNKEVEHLALVDNFFYKNAIRFLFGPQKIIPPGYNNFLAKNNIDVIIPKWLV